MDDPGREPTIGRVLAGYLAALVMGVTLGAIGAGGSILTVPILVYLFGVDPIQATAYSLFVVGLTALVGAAGYARKGLIDYRAAVLFGLPSLAGVFSVRLWVIPNLPGEILGISKATFVLVTFALVMLAAATSMIHPGKDRDRGDARGAPARARAPAAIVDGAVVGALTGFVGAGGGFLIVPALVFLLRLPMRRAIGTSLAVIAGKSLLGFCGDLGASQTIDWRLMLSFAGVSSAGIWTGVKLGSKVPAARLKAGFGWFVLATGLTIIGVELP